ncbi:hypothetical protein [Streptomyces sp. NBC_01190]|uniref:hypothetical protein n=1 Tax=Streptomyces sp. NBC_01190 TaxID=2903767 RepID=UPI0038664BAC|nr:hypothetical protein OG519_30470 [Streptomyces sp. NBC_01190]
MADKKKAQQSEAARTAGEQHLVEDTDQELTEEDLEIVDGGDGGQTTYPPYL